MKLLRKMLILAAIACLLISVVFSVQSYAGEVTGKDMMDKASNFIKKGSASAAGVDMGNAVSPIASFGSILTTVGVGVLVIVTIIMGIRYITATPETQGKLKQQLIGLVVAAFVIFGSYTIWVIVVDIVKDL